MDKHIKGHYILEIRPLTALSINSGNQLDCASYVIEAGGKVAVIDVPALVSKIIRTGSPSLRHEVTTALDKASQDLYALRTFISKHYDEEDVLYRSIINRYTQGRISNSMGNQNVNEIYRCPIDGESRPVIPGSSIKGAVRTAFSGQASKDSKVIDDDMNKAFRNQIADLDEFGRNKKQQKKKAKMIERQIDAQILFSQKFLSEKDKKASYSLEKDFNLMKKPNYSAMRSLAISDCLPVRCETEFSFTTMPGRAMGKALPIIDVIRGSLLGSDSVFSGVLSLEEDTSLVHPLDIDTIVNDCNAFARATFDEEEEALISILRSREDKFEFDIYDKLAGVVRGQRKENEFLLRMGRFSQREYVTYSNDLRYVGHTRNENYPQWGNTRTMMVDGHDLIPVGWCMCSIQEA